MGCNNWINGIKSAISIFAVCMQLKDYYGILEIESSATLPEIKKAYRRLAQQYHPDKKPGDAYASAHFTAIKEAYEVLSDPSKKEYYLQQRWYMQSMGKRKTQPVITPVSVLKLSLELEKHVSRLDHFRMDTEGLHDYIFELINNDTVNQLNGFTEVSTNDKIVEVLLDCLKPLPFALTGDLYKQLGQITISPEMSQKLSDHARLKEKRNKKDRYMIWMILAIVVLCCLMIFLLGKNK